MPTLVFPAIRFVLLLLLLGGCAMKTAPIILPTPPTTIPPQVRSGPFTVEERVAQFGEAVGSRLQEPFAKAGISYPPERFTLIALKQDRILELWADNGGGVKYIKSYPFTAFSGGLGPKLRQGDGQIPEGIYRIDYLNPNSSYHLSLKLDYPNAFDRSMAKNDQRHKPGGDIFIHGKDKSIGCVAIGDPAVEELFILTALVGREKVAVMISPVDFRDGNQPPHSPTAPAWLNRLHTELQQGLLPYRQPPFRTVSR